MGAGKSLLKLVLSEVEGSMRQSRICKGGQGLREGMSLVFFLFARLMTERDRQWLGAGVKQRHEANSFIPPLRGTGGDINRFLPLGAVE